MLVNLLKDRSAKCQSLSYRSNFFLFSINSQLIIHIMKFLLNYTYPRIRYEWLIMLVSIINQLHITLCKYNNIDIVHFQYVKTSIYPFISNNLKIWPCQMLLDIQKSLLVVRKMTKSFEITDSNMLRRTISLKTYHKTFYIHL